MAAEGECWSSETSHLSLILFLEVDVGGFERAIPAAFGKHTDFPLLKGFRVGEAGILQVLWLHDCSFSRGVTKAEVGKISQPQ